MRGRRVAELGSRLARSCLSLEQSAMICGERSEVAEYPRGTKPFLDAVSLCAGFKHEAIHGASLQKITEECQALHSAVPVEYLFRVVGFVVARVLEVARREIVAQKVEAVLFGLRRSTRAG